MADLRLPFNFMPGAEMPPEQLQANFDFIRQLIADIDSRVTSFTGLTVTGTLSAATANTTDLSATSTLQVGSAGATLNAAASTGLVSQSAQTAFTSVYPTAVGGVDKTGNLAALEYTTVDFSVGGAYNNSTYTFTAPVAGKYLFIASADVAARGGTPATVWNFAIVTTSYTYRAREIPSGTNRQTMQVAALVSMALNDTAKVTMTVGSGSEQWNIGSTINGVFSGSLIN